MINDMHPWVRLAPQSVNTSPAPPDFKLRCITASTIYRIANLGIYLGDAPRGLMFCLVAHSADTQL